MFVSSLIIVFPQSLHPPPLFQSLQEEPTSTSSQLAELMMAARVNLSSQLPRDLPPDALVNHGTFLINLEGEELQHQASDTRIHMLISLDKENSSSCMMLCETFLAVDIMVTNISHLTASNRHIF